MGRSGWARLTMAIGIALAAVLLVYSLRGIDWREVGRLALGARPSRLLLAGLIMTSTLFLRAVRWRVLLNAEGNVPVGTAFWATAAGYFGNNFLPARGGELMRTFMISAASNISAGYVLATAFAERAADVVALVIIAGLVLPAVPSRPDWLPTAARTFAAIGAAGALLIAVLPRMPGLCSPIVERLPCPARFRPLLLELADQVLRGLRAFHDAGRLGAFAGLTAIIWTLDAIATIVGASALGLALPMRAAFLLLAALGLGSALPSAPGYVGIYQFVAVSVLPPFGLSRTDAIAYIIVAQAFMYVVVALWGGIGFVAYPKRTTPAAPRSRSC